MKKKFYKTLVALAMVSTMLSVTACGNGANEPVSTEPEESTVETTESEEESSSEEASSSEETETEESAETETEAEALDPTNRTYETYAVFISEFELENGILTVKTEDVGIADYPIPKEMEFEFSYPLAEECKWCTDETEVDKELAYKWYDFDLEGALFELDEYYDGHTGYKSGEEVAKAHGLWTFTVVDGEVVEFCQIYGGVVSVTGVDTTDVSVANQNNNQSKTETEKPTQTTATPEPHVHSFSETITV